LTKRSVAGLCGLLLLLLGCGNPSSSPAAKASATALNVSVQPGDLPKGMRKCGVSGDIDAYLNRLQAMDPNGYPSSKSDWDSAQKQGATAGYMAFYTDSTAHCTDMNLNISPLTLAGLTYGVVWSFVIQFKDEASAGTGYTSESIFGFSPSTAKSGPGAIVGTASGLTANSVVLDDPSDSLYLAYWQSKAFISFLMVVYMDSATGKKAALAMNSRVK
jgi:hypothetical protein